MVKSALTRSEFNEVGEKTRREETNAVEESIEEAADRMLNPLIYGTSPSVNIPFIPGTSSRRKATGSGDGVFPAFEFQKELSGEHQVFLSSAINPVEFNLQLVSKESQLERMQDELNDMELSMSSRKIRYNLRQICFLLFQHFQSLVLSKKGRECVARYLDDGRMYRAKVTEVTNKGVEVELATTGTSSFATNRISGNCHKGIGISHMVSAAAWLESRHHVRGLMTKLPSSAPSMDLLFTKPRS